MIARMLLAKVEIEQIGVIREREEERQDSSKCDSSAEVVLNELSKG